jgi:hypothetical protein
MSVCTYRLKQQAVHPPTGFVGGVQIGCKQAQLLQGEFTHQYETLPVLGAEGDWASEYLGRYQNRYCYYHSILSLLLLVGY